MKRLIAAAFVLILSMLFAAGGCTTKGVGELSVTLSDLQALSSGSTGVQAITVVAKNGGLTFTSNLDFQSGQTSCLFQSILAGVWTVEASGNDAGGKTIYYDKVTAIVKKGATTAASLSLKPVNGEYEMSLDLSGIDTATVATAEVWVYPLGEGSYTKKHVITGELNKVHTLTATGIKPQSYEFQIRLFNAAGANIYLGPWYSFDVLPASKTDITASLEFSDFSVSLAVLGIPLKPSINSMFATVITNNLLEVMVSWNQPGGSELEKTIFFVRFYETERFEQAYVFGPATMPETFNGGFSIDSDDYIASGRIWVKIMTIGKNGQKSIASDARRYPNT